MSGKLLLVMVGCVFVLISCDSKSDQGSSAEALQKTPDAMETTTTGEAPLITFIELGSVTCIPCQKMQPVMKNIEARYGQQVAVIFYDVWLADQKPRAREYGIRLIPTQIFLDGAGKEIFRHEGFFPETEIDQFLSSRGIEPKSGS